MKRMKAQFFILGAILLCSLFFIGLPSRQAFTSAPSDDMEYVMQNLEDEFPAALNLGMESGNPGAVMEDFSSWSRDVARGLLMDMAAFWLFAEVDPSSGNVTVSAGNYMGTALNLAVELDGDERNLYLQDGESSSTTFSMVSPEYSLDIRFGNVSRTLTWNRDRVNLFTLIELERGGNLARSEIVA